jgi:hypothetical protein
LRWNAWNRRRRTGWGSSPRRPLAVGSASRKSSASLSACRSSRVVSSWRRCSSWPSRS